MKYCFSQEDLAQIEAKGMTVNAVEEQLESFKKGFPYLKLESSASLGSGIKQLNDSAEAYAEKWDKLIEAGVKSVKFVPASGAASRMFKDLFGFLDADYDTPETSFEKNFFTHIKTFAFYNALNEMCQKNEGADIDSLIADGKYKSVVENLLAEKGLNYGWLPKGLLLFHNYAEAPRAAMEEHLVEGALYAKNEDATVNIHFTVSHDHMPFFKELTERVVPSYEKEFGVKYNISFSEQKPETDTIAADGENQPFRENGALLFLPGGHGSLI